MKKNSLATKVTTETITDREVNFHIIPENLAKRPPSRGKTSRGYSRSSSKTLLFDRYRIGKVLGEGANAVVKLLEPRANVLTPPMAIKQFKDKENWPTAKMEARILRELSHKNIIKIDSLYKHADKVYLILEYFDAPNLSEVMREKKGSFEEAIVCKIVKQLVEALAHCHQRGIYHLDVKPENILVNENWKIKLIDFAFSVKMIDQSKIKKYCGTPTYMAPEILKKESYFPQKADSWSVGIVAFRLFTGKAPFKGRLPLSKAKKQKKFLRK